MAHDPITAALDFGGKLLDKFVADPKQKDEAKLKLLEMAQNGDLARLTAETDLAKGQLQINAEEAKSASLFVSGWRPAVGWVCVLGLTYTFFLRPLLEWYAVSHGMASVPVLDMGDLITLLLGMLGLGSLRTAEKIKGVASR
jgi:hypothetical protein